MFLVKCADSRFVYELKEVIKREIEDLAPKNTRTITLYLARRKSDGSWLSDGEETEKMLVELQSPETQFDEMRPSRRIRNSAFGFPTKTPEGGVIHVLVELERLPYALLEAPLALSTGKGLEARSTGCLSAIGGGSSHS